MVNLFSFITLALTLTTTTYAQDGEEEHPPHQGCLLMIKDRLPAQAKLVGKAFEDMSHSGYKVENESGATAATCTNNMAGGYPCNNVDLHAMLDIDELKTVLSGSRAANDIWGWTHSGSGREFAIVGLHGGTVFVEITNPTSPIYLGGLPTEGGGSSWRDIKTIGNYAVIGSEESGHGMQIFDLRKLLTASPNSVFTRTQHYKGFSNSHNLFANEDTGYVYAVGTNTCSGGLHIVNMNNPEDPKSNGCYPGDGYTHDVQCVVYDGPDDEHKGKEICFASNEDTVTILDVSNKNNIIQLARKGYDGDRYTHQGWLSEDHSYFIFNDELDEYYGNMNTRTHVLNVSDLDNPTYVGYHDGRTKAIDHNLYVKGDYVYQANYRAGLNVLKINDLGIADFDEAGFFDVYPNNDDNKFNGAWSTYPYFPSGTIIASGIEQGLFILKYTGGTSTSSPVASPVANTDSPVASPVANTDSPVASPVANTNSPVASPVGTTQPTGSCTDETEYASLVRRNGDVRVRTCDSLAEKPIFRREKICFRKTKWGEDDGVIYAPPAVACKVTCESCDECYESDRTKFVYLNNRGRKRVGNCKRLGRSGSKSRICNEGYTDNIYPSAAEACPETCGVSSC